MVVLDRIPPRGNECFGSGGLGAEAYNGGNELCGGVGYADGSAVVLEPTIADGSGNHRALEGPRFEDFDPYSGTPPNRCNGDAGLSIIRRHVGDHAVGADARITGVGQGVAHEVQVNPGELPAEICPTVGEKPGETIEVCVMPAIAHEHQHWIWWEGVVLAGHADARRNGERMRGAAEATDGLSVCAGVGNDGVTTPEVSPFVCSDYGNPERASYPGAPLCGVGETMRKRSAVEVVQRGNADSSLGEIRLVVEHGAKLELYDARRMCRELVPEKLHQRGGVGGACHGGQPPLRSGCLHKGKTPYAVIGQVAPRRRATCRVDHAQGDLERGTEQAHELVEVLGAS